MVMNRVGVLRNDINSRACNKFAIIMQKIIVIIFISHKYTNKQVNTLLVSILDNLIV